MWPNWENFDRTIYILFQYQLGADNDKWGIIHGCKTTWPCLLYVARMLINYEELAYLGEHLGVNFKYFYCINCSAIQGFPILRKALSTHEKYDNFTCVWYRQSAAYTSLASSTPWIPSSFSIEASLSKFLRLGSWLLKYWKIVMANGGRQPKYKKKNRKLHNQWLC